MTFARFMDLALYDPEAGYYAGGATGPGRHGDFLTAPEGHPIFGWAVARHLESVWAAIDRPARFVVREHGAGSGALAAGILDGLRRSGSPLLDAIAYQAVDVAPARLDALAARLAVAGLDRHLVPIDDSAGARRDSRQRAARRPAGPPSRGGARRRNARALRHARSVGRATGFATELGLPRRPPSRRGWTPRASRLEPGQPAEICLAIDGWVARRAAPLERGVAPPHRLRLPGCRALQPGPRQHAPRLPPPPGPRRPAGGDRAPGPDRARRPHRGRARGGRSRAGAARPNDAGAVPCRPRHRRAARRAPVGSVDDARVLPRGALRAHAHARSARDRRLRASSPSAAGSRRISPPWSARRRPRRGPDGRPAEIPESAMANPTVPDGSSPDRACDALRQRLRPCCRGRGRRHPRGARLGRVRSSAGNSRSAGEHGRRSVRAIGPLRGTRRPWSRIGRMREGDGRRWTVGRECL